ncbi:MAG: hypothetical protein ACI4KJ_01745, partial [Anaerovoracaceae bacterium]
SPARVKIEKSQRECLGNRLGSTLAGTLASGLFCKFCCEENFSPVTVKLEISQKNNAARKAETPSYVPFLLANSSRCYIWRIFLIIKEFFKKARKPQLRLPLSSRRSLLSLDLSRRLGQKMPVTARSAACS